MLLAQDTRTAVYCRLSREDGNEESQSIQAQKEILVDYVHNQGWQLYDIYIDDGYSGTNFDRPDFQRLLKDVEKGNIDIHRPLLCECRNRPRRLRQARILPRS